MADEQAEKVEVPRQEIIGPKGRFVKGNQFGKRHGRKKGVPNLVSSSMKQALIGVAEEIGSDGKGKDGKNGYLKELAKTNPDLFAHHLLKATVPPAREGEGENTGYAGPAILLTIRSAESGRFYTDRQTKHFEAHGHFEGDDCEMHSHEEVIFHNMHGRFPNAEEIAFHKANDRCLEPHELQLRETHGRFPEPLRLISADNEPIDETSEFKSPEEAAIFRELAAMSHEQLVELARRTGVPLDDDEQP